MKNVLGGRQTQLKMGVIGKKETDRRLPQRGLVKWYHVGALEACVPERCITEFPPVIDVKISIL